MSIMPFRLKHLGLLTAGCLLAACQTFTDGDRQLREQGDRLFDEALAQSRQSQTPPPAVQAALLPPLLPEVAALAGGPRFDVAARDMDAREFFLSLMDSAGQNLVVHPEVTGTITFSLRNVTLDEVLTAVRDSYGYDFQRTSYGYRILPNQLLTRTYDLNYLNLQRRGETDTRVSAGTVTTSEETSNDSNDGTTTSNRANTVNASQVVTSSQVDFWREVADVIGALIGDEAGNKVVVNPQASLLVVRASSADQQNVEAFLKQAEQNLQRQVILEAKILEVRLSDQFQAGINWTQLGSRLDLDLTGEALSGASGIGGVFSALYTSGDFSALLQLLETQGQVRVLSSPRISTLNNQKAVIKVGTDEYFVTDISSTNTTTLAGVSEPTQDVTLTPFFSGISLDVTPQINRQEEVTLHVRPTVSRVQDQNKVITLGEDKELNLPLALSTTRQSDSIVRARSGQVVVIGGLLEDINSNTDANVPWMSKLPFLGWFFQQQRKDLERSELVILLRPQVIGADTWLDELQKSAASFRELR
ncbi:pilus (MSHA type) biogenesis protein MshL [Pseudomonas oryzae]|uniref:MSHA biogenesis protein MshL n=1 Tax=Pseudomonas oryzae TaxID=1392877 RepID=A0A1H1WHV2_9PSED|nr:pilus (MSHA type) biogenesis protein MshL [Pseudomonas oryzae]SDS96928.1 MSHA biogenesis protein MshL [Pseudomonas oryzae]